MNTSTEPFGLPDTAPELARRFAVIMAGLGTLIARRFLKMPHLSGFTVLLYGRLNRAVRRLHRALTRPAGKVRAARARAGRADGAPAASGAVARERPVALPSGRGWIVRELGWEAAAYMLHLEVLLAEPGTQAALEAKPGLWRILRPICRMLGVVMPVAAPAVLVVADVVDLVSAPEPDTMSGVWLEIDAVGLPGIAGDCEVPATCW